MPSPPFATAENTEAPSEAHIIRIALSSRCEILCFRPEAPPSFSPPRATFYHHRAVLLNIAVAIFQAAGSKRDACAPRIAFQMKCRSISPLISAIIDCRRQMRINIITDAISTTRAPVLRARQQRMASPHDRHFSIAAVRYQFHLHARPPPGHVEN